MNASEAQTLKSLLETQPIAALATLHKGEPAVSMVPFALLPGSTNLVIHVSRLATHTNDMLANPAVSFLVTASAQGTDSPLALPRASVQGRARPCEPESLEYHQSRAAYLAKLPEAEELFSFADFSLFLVETRTVRYVAGFGRAMSLTAQQLAAILAGAAAPDSESTADRELVHSRLIDAPPERVFRAFAEPEHLAKWWGPNGFTSTFRTFEPQPGGRWQFVMHGPDGTDYPNESVFREVVAPERIVLEHLSESHHFFLTVTFAAQGDKTLVGWRQVFDSADHKARIAGFVSEANEQNLSRLANEVLNVGHPDAA